MLLLKWFKHFHFQIQPDTDNYCGRCQFDVMLLLVCVNLTSATGLFPVCLYCELCVAPEN